jgi:hypothetical protein
VFDEVQFETKENSSHVVVRKRVSC